MFVLSTMCMIGLVRVQCLYFQPTEMVAVRNSLVQSQRVVKHYYYQAPSTSTTSSSGVSGGKEHLKKH